MAEIALSVVQTLFAALQSTELKEIFSIWGYKSELKDLEETVVAINKFLLDVHDRGDRLSLEERGYVEKLKSSVYDADDLFDEVLTLAELKKHKKSDKLSKKVIDFFSVRNPLSTAYTMSQEIKKIRRRLDTAVSNHSKFGFKSDIEPIRRRGEETCSYVYEPDVVGREDDVKILLEKLLDFSVEKEIGFLSIVGIGGLGKTTLAQLVYNDERVRCEFPMRLWVSVSDQDRKGFDVKGILSRILESAGDKLDDGLSKERAQSRFQENFRGKKCLLVLDDVWNEDCYKWRELRGFLMRFGRGSRIILTSRSKESARITGNDHSFTYELGGLSEENSWRLFELTAFGVGDEHENLPELVEIGKKIVKQCFNVPLAIKVVGSLLFGQEISKWRTFGEEGLTCLANTCQDGNMIMSILKLSYDNLNSPLKSCFSHCALFPKGFRIRKQMLISLWMSQGYIKPFYDGQNMEVAANEQFSILLRRCFFQDVQIDEYGDVTSCKIHDLMHDVAQEVAGYEISTASCMRTDLGDSEVRHVYDDREHFGMGSFVKSKIRSYLRFSENEYHYHTCTHWNSVMKSLIKNWTCLRTLTVHHSPVKRIPDAIGNLVHLRNLDLHSSLELESLPTSITKLHNLQTLVLANCWRLKELPKDLSKLVNIRHLDIRGCSSLTHMPAGLHKLTSLTVLSAFYVGVASLRQKKQNIGQLRDLKHLKNLTDEIKIIIPENYGIVEERNQEYDILANMERLTSVELHFDSRYDTHDEDERCTKHESMMGKLQPHPNVKGLELTGYLGEKIPRWGKAEHNWVIFLPCLVKIQLDNCRQLKELPLLSELRYLRSLKLGSLHNVEYMEERPTSNCDSNSASFFPSLECLRLHGILKLKGWWRREESSLPYFPRLSTLAVTNCPNLISFPSCPIIETLHLQEVNEKLKLITQVRAGSNLDLNVREVKIGHVNDLKALPPCHPTSISITTASVETFLDANDVFKTHGSTSLRHLQIESCGQLRSLSGGGFQHLTALESLEISFCSKLSLNDDIPWRSFRQNLTSISLCGLTSMEILSSGMQDLSSLRHLTIEFCQKFLELPEWINCLSSLQSLIVRSCGKIKSLPEGIRSLISLRCLQIIPCSQELKQRFDPDGVDWPKIQHIPDVSLFPLDIDPCPEALQFLSTLSWDEIEDYEADTNTR